MSNHPLILGLPELPENVKRAIADIEKAVDHLATYPDPAVRFCALAQLQMTLPPRFAAPLLGIGVVALKGRGEFKLEGED